MNTQMHIVLCGGTKKLLEYCESLVHECEQLWSRFVESSDISRLNNAAGTSVVVSPITYTLLKTSVQAWEQSRGVFNPAIGSSMLASGYAESFEKRLNVPAKTVDCVVPAGDPSNIVFDEQHTAVAIPSTMRLDLGGIAKGFCADYIFDYCMQSGSKGALVNIGGDIRVGGKSPSPGGWSIACQKLELDTPFIVKIQKGAICTSSRMKRRWKVGESWQNHLRDPETGTSLTGDAVAVTVLCARAAQGEVLAKILMASPADSWNNLAREFNFSGFILAGEKKEIITLPNLDRYTG